jgi:hypothetical protein
MRRTLLTALALGLTGAVVPAAAHAATPDKVYGGCAFVSD